ncbi:MAG: helix-turn-helix transcriptional regulator [Gemmatimonadaceae bacterium]
MTQPRPQDALDALDTPSGVRVGARRLAAMAAWRVGTVGAGEGAACLICIAGVGTLDEPGATYLVRPGFMAVRRAPWTGTVAAGPEPMRLVAFRWTRRALAALGPTALGLARARTLYGRGSIEIAWRAAGELRVRDPHTPMALELYAQGVALNLTRAAAHRHTRGLEPPRAARARRALERRLAGPLDLAALAREAGCAPQYLSRLFRRTYGASPSEYLLRRRVERARHLLARGRRPIANIALELGFHDASHFARHFRRFAGVSPGEFRRRQADAGVEVNSVPT